MNCIFCKTPSDESKSVEHIIPESLGNKQFILPKGMVCDKCNNYFAVKIEQPVLQLPFFQQNRHDLNIESKKRKIPTKTGFLLDENTTKAILHKNKNKEENIEIDTEAIRKLFSEGAYEIPLITVTYGVPYNNSLVSKLLTKMAVEFLTYDGIAKGYDASFYHHECLNVLKQYVRNSKKNEFWQYTIRTISSPENCENNDLKTYLDQACGAVLINTSEHLFFQFLFSKTEFILLFCLVISKYLSTERYYSQSNFQYFANIG